MNELVIDKSKDADLVMMNLPTENEEIAPSDYMALVTTMTRGTPALGHLCRRVDGYRMRTAGLDRCLLVNGNGAEVVTIYS